MAKQIANVEVAVLGAGPAGLALAAAMAERGLETVVLSPNLEGPWRQSYGAFADAVDRARVGAFEVNRAVRSRHRRPEVLFDGQAAAALDAEYVRLDTARLQFGLLDAVKSQSVRLIDAEVKGVVRADGPNRDTYLLAANVELRARYVFDTTGSASRLTRRDRATPMGYQSAFGRWLVMKSLPIDAEAMWLMDYRDQGEPGPVSFLYVIPEGNGLVFAQETVLASTDPVPMSQLEARLTRRIDRLGWQIESQIEDEHCVIPLGIGLPDPRSPTFAFGAAAGFVNPVSGYQLGRALRSAKRVASAVASGATTEAIQDAIWTKAERDAYQLYHVALDQMLRIPPREFRRFIQSFFALPKPLWLGFMMGEQEPREVAATMWRLFRNAPNSLRLQLIHAASSFTAESLFSLTKDARP